MSWIEVEGPKDALRRLTTIPGVGHVARGSRPADPESQEDRWVVFVTLTDEAVATPAIEALGCVVHTVKTDAEIRAMLEEEWRNRPAEPGEPVG